MIKHTRTAFSLTAGLQLLAAASAWGQRAGDSTALDSIDLANRAAAVRRCVEARRTVERGVDAPGFAPALHLAVRCTEEGATVAAYLWRNAPADTGRLSALVGASYVRDRRILDAVTAVATDPARPQLVRLAALRILAIYGDPHLLLEWSDLEPPPVIGGLVQGRNLPHIGHPYAPDGPQPLTAADAQAIRQSLDLLSRSDADERVRGAAESIIYALRLYDRARE